MHFTRFALSLQMVFKKTTDMLNLETIALQVCDIAREAGAYIKKERASFSVEKVERKHAHDYVSYVDKGSEQLIVKALRALLPEAGFITEEGTAKGDDVGCLKDEEGCTWVVDPLDGTNSYSQGLPVFCVSIGVTYKGECVVGVVYAPYLDELYTAVKGEGAWFGKAGEVSDATRLHVSSKESLKECVVASGFPYDKATHPINNIREVSIVIPQVRGFRRMGSAAYDLCCTAMGTIDAYWEFNLNLWDVCAGQLIVREAGGQVVPLCDNRKISIIAGPEKLVKELFLCL